MSGSCFPFCVKGHFEYYEYCVAGRLSADAPDFAFESGHFDSWLGYREDLGSSYNVSSCKHPTLDAVCS
jgi:hypothetical protein